MATAIPIETSFREIVSQRSHQNVDRCYDCDRCTAGCPVAYAMQYGPHRILQMVRFGFKEAALSSGDIWLCAACETCGARCPNDVDIAHVMDVLRQMAIAEGIRNPATDLANFHRIYLLLIGWFGRVHEASLMVMLKLLTRDFLGDMGAGVRLIAKGKIPPLPQRIKGARAVSRLL